MSTDHRVRARDRGIRRVSVLTRWTIGGGLALSGVFSVLAERQFSQHLQMVAAANAAADPASLSGATSAGSSAIAAALPDVPTTVAPLAPPTTTPRSVAASSGASTARRPVSTTRSAASPRTTVHVPTTVRRVIIQQPQPRPIVVSGGS